MPDVRAPWLMAWIAFVYLAWGASPAHFWLDSGEIGAAGVDLGVAHPPGAPGLLLVLHLAGMLPLGSLGFRMALVSSALGAATVGLVVSVLQRRGVSTGLAVIVGLWVLAGLTFVRQTRVVEIYALAGALTMVTVWGLDLAVTVDRRTGRRLVAVAAATWAAWCFGDLRLALGPVVLIAWIAAWRARAPWARWAPPIAAMASLVILTLPLASAGAPTLDWGQPHTASALVDHLGARSIRESFADEILPASWALWGVHAGAALERLAEDLGPPGLVVAVICLGLLWRRDPSAPPPSPRRVEAAALTWVVAVELLYIVGINPMGGPDRQTGLVLAPVAALVVGEVSHRWLRDRGRLRWAVLPLLATVLVLPPALVSVPDVAVTRSWAPHAWTRAALEQLPPSSLLLTQSDDLAAGSISARVLEGARPDVVSIPAQHLYRPMPRAAADDPRRVAIWTAAHGQADETARIEAAIASHRPRPVALEQPRAGIVAAVRWYSPHGHVPLRVAGPPGLAEHLPLARPAPAVLDHWLPRLPTDEDRRRLAIALANRARAEVRVGGSIERAKATLGLVLARVDPRHASAMVTLAALLDRTGDRDEAIAVTRRALQLEPDRHAALTNLALYLSRAPASDAAARAEARALAERAVSLRPWRADGWARLAQVCEATGDAQCAATAHTQARARATSAR